MDATLSTPIVTLEMVRASQEVFTYIHAADEQAVLKGYTEHGPRHANLVSTVTGSVLAQLGAPGRRVQLGAIAGFLHDIGIVLGRGNHASSGGALAMVLLHRLGMPAEEVVPIIAAIANHDEGEGEPVSDISAALILADKADVHRSRVRNPIPATFDIHDRVNFATRRCFVLVDAVKKTITYDLSIDTEFLPGGNLAFFEIFMPRMVMARRAAAFLKCEFHLHINNTRVA